MTRQRLLGIAVVAVAAAVANVVLVRLPENGVALEVSAVEARAGDQGDIDVAVTVANPLSEPAGGRVWWLLAPPGEGSEWDRRVYQSSVRTVEVPPGRSARLAWTEANPVPGGSYVVSAWVHVPGRNGFVHGDGRVATHLRIDIPTGGLLRARPPASGVRIDAVDVSAGPAGSGLLVTEVTVVSTTGTARRAQVHLALSPAMGAGDRQWWRVPPVWVSQPVTVELDGPSAEHIPITARWPETATGQYAVRAVLGDVLPQRDGPLDEVALPVPVSPHGAPGSCPVATFCPPGVYHPLGSGR